MNSYHHGQTDKSPPNVYWCDDLGPLHAFVKTNKTPGVHRPFCLGAASASHPSARPVEVWFSRGESTCLLRILRDALMQIRFTEMAIKQLDDEHPGMLPNGTLQSIGDAPGTGMVVVKLQRTKKVMKVTLGIRGPCNRAAVCRLRRKELEKFIDHVTDAFRILRWNLPL